MPQTNNRSARRSFLRKMGGLAAASFLLPFVPPILRDALAQQIAEDEQIFHNKFAWATSNGFAGKPLGEIAARIGISFVGSPYEAHLLEVPGDEQLVINLRAFDCVTFVESSLALARCVKAMASSFQDFSRELRQIRYRGGSIKGYASRLHYFSEWIRDNEKKGLVRDMTQRLGGRAYKKPLNFMSTHRGLYTQLENDGVFQQIVGMERDLLQYTLWSISRGSVASAERHIRNGDIIALTTSMDGLEVSHTGLAALDGPTVRFLHAPLSTGSVRLSEGSLAEYVERSGTTTTGIVVVRPQEP